MGTMWCFRNSLWFFYSCWSAVNLCDILMSLYCIKLRTKKWYMHLVYYCIGLLITNGWLLCKRHALQSQVKKTDPMSLLNFQSWIALILMQENKVVAKRGHPRSNNTPNVQKKSKSNPTFLPPNETVMTMVAIYLKLQMLNIYVSIAPEDIHI